MLLELHDVSKSYPTGEGLLQVLRGVSLALDAGQSLALTGESGSGKSTLLHLAGGLDRPDGGAILFEGRDIVGLGDTELAAYRRDGVGLVFQQFNLIPSLDVAADLAFQARLGGRFDAAWTGRLTERLGLAKLLDRYPEQLSGGQQQRVAIGRALAARPQLILADEPTGALDSATSVEVMALLQQLNRTGITVVLVTHEQDIAAFASRLLAFRDGLVVSDRANAPQDAAAALARARRVVA
jgi:putative ABC transport system ATP-binding protein